MSDWVSPVREQGDLVVVGERHRKASSRHVLNRVWEEYDFDAVCVEVGPGTSYRDDGGGAVGGALVSAHSAGLPRYYVDESVDTVIEAFGGRYTAYRYLKGLEESYPDHEDGLINKEATEDVRREIRQDYGDDAYDLLLARRERKMAGRAKWVAEQSDGKVLLVVGAAHLDPIVELLEQGVEPIEVDSRRVRRGERLAGFNDFELMFIMCYRSLKAVDWPSPSEALDSLHQKLRLG